LKHEVIGKTVHIALELLAQGNGLDLVEVGQISVEHDFFAANKVNAAGDAFDGNNGLLFGHGPDSAR